MAAQKYIVRKCHISHISKANSKNMKNILFKQYNYDTNNVSVESIVQNVLLNFFLEALNLTSFSILKYYYYYFNINTSLEEL